MNKYEEGEVLLIDTDPLVRHLNERLAEGEIEGIFFTGDAIKALAQNALEVLRRDQIGERADGGRLDPGVHQRADGGMDLVAAQPH